MKVKAVHEGINKINCEIQCWPMKYGVFYIAWVC